MSVLERFFQMSMVLTLILIGINFTIYVFGEPLTGEELFRPATGGYLDDIDISASDQTRLTDANTTVATTNIIEQVATVFTVPVSILTEFNKLVETILAIGGGYQYVLARIFEGLDTGTGQVVLIGNLLRTLILFIQACGFVYIPFALWSTFKGGGSGP